MGTAPEESAHGKAATSGAAALGIEPLALALPSPEMKRSIALPIHLTLATSTGAVFLAALLLTGNGQMNVTDNRPAPFHVKQGSVAPSREGSQGGYAAIVDSVKPSIVSILSWTSRPGTAGSPPETPATPDSPSAPPPEGKPSLMGVGSGVVLTGQGHVLTNNHVVADAQWIWVVLPESSERLNARVLGRDNDTDLAVLKVEKPGISAATFGNSDLMKAGDVVLAIGNPFGLSQTVTSGIVSATSRSELDIAGFENFIQTDASINPGNSGGALINTNGEVIGINTAIFSRNGGNVGVGFAISANLALKIARKLVEKGEVARGYLGVTVALLTPELAKIFRVDSPGALISDVIPGSPAESAGIKPGDVVVDFNGAPVPGPTPFRMAVADLEPGAKAVLKIIRRGAPLAVNAILSRIPAAPPADTAPPQPAPPTSPPQPFLEGIYIEELTPALRLEHGIPFRVKGVIISRIQPEMILESGLRPGVVICEVVGKPVETVPAALAARTVPDAPLQDSLLLRVWMAGKGYQFAAVQVQH